MSAKSSNQRIALFVPSFRGGGAERAMVLFAEGLLQRGYNVDFLVAQDEGPLRTSLPKEARLVNFARKNVSRTIPSLARYLRRERPSALYSTIVNANITALCARALSCVTCPVIIRESNVLSPKGPLTFARRAAGTLAPLMYRLADSIISVSEDVATELCSAAPSLKNKISVLPNPVVSKTMLELAQAKPEHPWFSTLDASGQTDIPVIVGAGRLHPQKDFTTLISAFFEVRKVRDSRLLILGEGLERPKLEQQIKALGLENYVSLPGHINNPFPYLKLASTFVLSSCYEGMPNVLLQAMAFGTPVVATRCHSGACEVLTKPAFGQLVEVGAADEMAAAILSCLDLPRSAEAIKYVADHFSVERATKEYLEAAGLA